jgi:hypothetical protein
MMNFSQLVGQHITIQIPRLGDKLLHRVTLLGVDPAGLWIEGVDVIGAAYSSATGNRVIPSGQANAKLFVPFAEIALLMYVASE